MTLSALRARMRTAETLRDAAYTATNLRARIAQADPWKGARDAMTASILGALRHELGTRSIEIDVVDFLCNCDEESLAVALAWGRADYDTAVDAIDDYRAAEYESARLDAPARRSLSADYYSAPVRGAA